MIKYVIQLEYTMHIRYNDKNKISAYTYFIMGRLDSSHIYF